MLGERGQRPLRPLVLLRCRHRQRSRKTPTGLACRGGDVNTFGLRFAEHELHNLAKELATTRVMTRKKRQIVPRFALALALYC